MWHTLASSEPVLRFLFSGMLSLIVLVIIGTYPFLQFVSITFWEVSSVLRSVCSDSSKSGSRIWWKLILMPFEFILWRSPGSTNFLIRSFLCTTCTISTMLGSLNLFSITFTISNWRGSSGVSRCNYLTLKLVAFPSLLPISFKIVRSLLWKINVWKSEQTNSGSIFSRNRILTKCWLIFIILCFGLPWFGSGWFSLPYSLGFSEYSDTMV